MINLQNIKKDFPIFQNNPNLIYLDSTATTLKPLSVISKMEDYYKNYSANIFRGIYPISEKATLAYESARTSVAEFINAKPEEILFTRNTTESLNLLAYCLSDSLKPGDEIITTIVEHHSNFVPWQQLAIRKKLLLKVIPLNAEGYLDFQTKEGVVNEEKIGTYVSRKTKIVALTHISNVLGTVYPIEKIIKVIKRINPLCMVIVDGAQSVGHSSVDMKQLDVDYFAFSGHKMMGPTGVGVLYGRAELLEALPPFLYGGEMIREVYLKNTTFNSIPHKFEAGTPAIAEVIGLGEAVKVLKGIGMDAIAKQEHQLVSNALRALRENVRGLIILGPEESRSGIISFTLEKIHPHDIAQVLAEDGICVRAGHHCAMPLHESMQIVASTRASLYIYNTPEDISQLVTSLLKVNKLFSAK